MNTLTHALQWSRLQSEAVISQVSAPPSVAILLQWSRLQSEAVIRSATSSPAIPPRASMEPPPIGGGNLT